MEDKNKDSMSGIKIGILGGGGDLSPHDFLDMVLDKISDLEAMHRRMEDTIRVEAECISHTVGADEDGDPEVTPEVCHLTVIRYENPDDNKEDRDIVMICGHDSQIQYDVPLDCLENIIKKYRAKMADVKVVVSDTEQSQDVAQE